MKIPKQLQQLDFRFVLLDGHTKRPFEKDWVATNNYKFDDPKLLAHIAQGQNYGVLCGYGGLVILDVDDLSIKEEVETHLKSTFTIQTGSGKMHYYYIASKDAEKVVLEKNGVHYGELQARGAQCVGPGSIHPNTKQEYKVLNDLEISTLTTLKIELLKSLYTEQRKFEVQAPWSQYSASNLSNQLPIQNLINLAGFKKHDDEYYGAHPLHGSTTGMNFFVNPAKNLWHCFRCNSGGDSLAYLAVKNGICKCSDFSKNGTRLRGEAFMKVLEIGKLSYGLKIDDNINYKIGKLNTAEMTPEDLENVNIGDLELIYSDKVKDLDIKETEWLIEGILPKHSLSIFAGKSGSYKSISSLHMATAISEGKPVYGKYKTMKAKVLYINEENSWHIFKPHVERIQKGLETTGTDNLGFCTYQNLSLDIHNLEGRMKLEKLIKENKFEVLFLDSLKRFISFEENDADKVNVFYQIVLKPLAAKYGLTIIMLHHTKKDNNNGKFIIDKKDLLRGSSDFVNIVDTILFFDRGVKKLWYNLYQLKNRVSQEFEPKAIKIIAENEAFVFNELTTQSESTTDILENECIEILIGWINKDAIKEFTFKDVYEKFSEKYKRTSLYNAIEKMKVEEVIASAPKHKYKVNYVHKVFSNSQINTIDAIETKQDKLKI